MKLTIALLVVLCACSHLQPKSEEFRKPQSVERPFLVDNIAYTNRVTLRVGSMQEAGQLKGCVLYLEGLADSIRNHDPYFTALSNAGFRVIGFDYYGQGGSGGSMNDTRFGGTGPESIGTQARWFWNWYLNQPEGASCRTSKKLVIGWSTGGLAAYKLAHEKWADAVVLLSPGIVPRAFVGESATDKKKLLDAITFETLTRNRFQNEEDPHIDPIKPNSPAKILGFAISLLKTAKESEFWRIDPGVRGLAMIGTGSGDTYVKGEETLEVIKKQAPQFLTKTYPGAYHELDNELPEVAKSVQQETINFLDLVVAEESFK